VTRTVYGPPAAVAVRGVGLGAAGLGLVTIAAVVVLAAELPGWLDVTLLCLLAALALVSLLVLAVGVLRVFGRGARLVLDDDGFVNTTGFGLGARRGKWRDVRKVQADGTVVSVDLAGGRQSLIHTAVLDVEPRLLARELRSRLNHDRGYRNPPDGHPQADAGRGRPMTCELSGGFDPTMVNTARIRRTIVSSRLEACRLE
jgi:hypothetical protein